MNNQESTQRRARSFDALAEEYDRHRPTYPPDLIVEVINYAGRAVEHGVLEIGAGTGKATLAFAAEGLTVVALEPGEQMAAVLAREAAEHGVADLITLRRSSFETLQESDGPFGLIYSAQAFHWTDPQTRWERLVSLLSRGGALALFSNHWELDSGKHDVAAARDLTHRRGGPEVEPDLRDTGEDWETHLRDHDQLEHVEHRTFTEAQIVPTGNYLALMATTSQYAVLPEPERELALTELGRLLGPETHLGIWTMLDLARRA